METIPSSLFFIIIFVCSIYGTNTAFNNDTSSIIPNLAGDTLIAAHVIFRHGARNLETSYPNDPYRDEIHWPGGFGQLTKKGKRLAFSLGEFLRRRYNKLLGDEYLPNKIFVQSTDDDRCLASAQLVLAGLFIPSGNEIWNKNILWQPIPVHTLPKKLDNVLAAKRPCPKYTALLAKHLKQSKEIQQIYTKYADLFSYLTRMSGSNITTIYDVFDIYCTLDVERQQNKTLPSWASKAMEHNQPMEYIAKVAPSTYASTPTLARFKFGYLLKEMLEHFTQKINSTLSPDRSVWLYSGHDQTILNALNGLRIHDLHLPPYSSCLMFELHKSARGDHFVHLFYRKFKEEHPKPIKIPKCGEKCPLNEFEALYSDIIPGVCKETIFHPYAHIWQIKQ